LSGLTAHGGLITDGSFESPQLGFGTFAYTPASVAWDFIGGAGLINNSPAWPPPPSVDGTQVAFLQHSVGHPGGEIKQSVAFPVAGPCRWTGAKPDRREVGKWKTSQADRVRSAESLQEFKAL